MQYKEILPKEWDVPQRFRARLGEQAGRQRIMAEAGHLLLILHEPPSAGASDRKAKFFWRSPEGVWKAADSAGEGLKALQRHLNKYDSVVAQLEKQLASAQRAEDFFKILRATAPTLRTIRNMQHTLQQARENFQEVREFIVLRDQAYQQERTVDLLNAEAKYALDFTMAQRAEEQAQHGQDIAQLSHRLNLLASFFLPIMTLAALFGMSFPQTLGKFDNPLTLLTVLIVGVVFGYYLRSRYSLRRETEWKVNHNSPEL